MMLFTATLAPYITILALVMFAGQIRQEVPVDFIQ